MVLQKPKALAGLVFLCVVPLTGFAAGVAREATKSQGTQVVPGGASNAPRAPQSARVEPPSQGGSVVVANATAPPTPAGASNAVCAAGMIRVRGEACDEVEQTCKKYLDPPPYQNLRCGEYVTPSRCTGAKKALDFCIDREEAHDPQTELPTVSVSFVDAKAKCSARGLHLCKDDEWVFACEGEAMVPYPYGHARDSSACNIDKTNLGGPNGRLRDLRAKVSDYPRCLSPFGVHDMTGNVDEWVEREAGLQHSVLHGGWWLPGRNRCRATTAEHGPEYTAKQVGYRCCGATRPGG